MEKNFHFRFCGDRENTKHTVTGVHLIYMLSGTMDASVDDDTFAVREGDFFTVNAGQRFGWKNGRECLMARMEIDYGFFAAHLKSPFIYLVCGNVRGDMEKSLCDLILKVLSQLVCSYAAGDKDVGFHREYLWYWLMDLLTEHCVFYASLEAATMDMGQRMAFVIQNICANYAAPLPQNEAAKKSCLSPAAFSRWFKKHSGMNYGDFVANVRLAHSARDLLDTEKSVTEIAMNNGFSSVSVFSKAFKKYQGMTPVKYRMSRQQSLDREEAIINRVRSSQGYLKLWSAPAENENCRITADSRQGIPWEDAWNQAVNAGEAAELLSAKAQSQVLMIKEQLGVKYVRISNIFSGRMKLRRGHGVGRLNYDSLDSVFDFIIQNGMHPFIDLCDREHAAFLAMNEFLYKEQPEGIFLTREEMTSVLTSVFHHFAGRYGVSEVSSWLVECWYDDRQNRVIGIADDYARVFRDVSEILKKIAPGIRIGGCGLELGVSERHFRRIVKGWADIGVAPDFITLYIYPYEDVQSQISDFHYTLEKLALCKNILAQYHMESLDLYITEWNLSVSSRNCYNDSCAKAAMLLGHSVLAFGQAKMIIYSMFGDLLTDYYDSAGLFFGGPGMLTKNGLSKPVYYALLFLHRLSGKVIAWGRQHLITVSEDGCYYILLFCPKALNYKYFFKKEYDIRPSDLKEMFEDDTRLVLDIEIADTPPGKYYIRQYILDPDHGSILDCWLDMGHPENLNVSDMKYLSDISQPGIVFGNTVSVDGKIRIHETLEPHQIRLLEIAPQ